MTGLIYKDLLVYHRRISKVNKIMELVFFLIFLFAIKGRASAITYLILVLPVNMGGMAASMKEIDSTYKGMMHSMTMPFTHKQIILARFLAVYVDQLKYVAMMLVYMFAHYFLYGSYSFATYLQMFAAGWILGIIFAATNLFTSFTGSLNTTSFVYLGVIVVMCIVYVLVLLLRVNVKFLLNLDPAVWLAILAAMGILFVIAAFWGSYKIFEKKLP